MQSLSHSRITTPLPRHRRFPLALLALGLWARWPIPQAAAQTAPPETEIYLADLTVKKGSVTLGEAQNLTQRPGYDNQPYFSPDGKALWFTSFREGGQTDIYRYDFTYQNTEPLTRTPESEYSAHLMPDGQHFSIVRVEADGTQRLWQFRAADGQAVAPILPQLKPVGYYVWAANGQQLALFVLGQPNTLQLARLATGQTDTLARHIGRSLHLVPGGRAVSFIQKADNGPWQVMLLDLRTRKIKPLVATLPNCEDLTWTRNGIALMSQGSQIFKFDPKRDRTWVLVKDFASQGLKQITRLAVDPQNNFLALVGN